MPACPSCQHANPVDSDFCSRCGTLLNPASGVGADVQATRVLSESQLSAPSSPDGARFAAGAVVAERYRIVGLLGRGGMGEVYRADDLKLGQSVALKFLPVGLEQDPDRLSRFVGEVRTARQVTHANVCRVYDIGEFGGQHYLSMEYVDGEDLSSLLRRIGRLPEERAVEVARQICAGLAAVHEAGVLHRDLKPANVMIDGRGRVRLTDFGLASLSGSEARGGVAGTPAYMAPEQAQGDRASVRSDIYSLGLVLYELFTGRAVFEAETLADMQSMHLSTAPSRPSSYVDTLEPAVESVVLRCLEKSPESRPPSALSVSAALPGGDPLAAALAAGETPSPELVAATGDDRVAMRPWVASVLALAGLAVIVFGAQWAAHSSWLAVLPFEKRPQVLEDRARELIETLGYTDEAFAEPVDRAWGWLLWDTVLREYAATESTRAHFEGLRERPDAAGYWYRQAPWEIIPNAYAPGPMFVRAPVDVANPPMWRFGDMVVLMGLDGTLRRLEVQPRRFTVKSPSEPDWSPLFEAAGFDRDQLTEVEPHYQRFMAPDLRRAWVGPSLQRPDVEYRIEAGASEGRAVLFNVATQASMADLSADPQIQRRGFVASLINNLPATVPLILTVLLFVAMRRNLQDRRSDTRGAWRLGLVVFTVFVVSKGLKAHALYGDQWAVETWLLLSGSLLPALVIALTYLATEPIGRQVWPSMFVSSGRLLSRPTIRLRDPIVGRSILWGVLAGAAIFVLTRPLYLSVTWNLAPATEWRFGVNFGLLGGGRMALGSVLDVAFDIAYAYFQVAVLVVFQRWVRKRWLAVALAIVVWAAMDGALTLPSILRDLLTYSLLMVVLLRAGVLAFVISQLTFDVVWNARAVDLGHWTAEGAWIALTVVAIWLAYGVFAATGGHSRRVAPGGLRPI